MRRPEIMPIPFTVDEDVVVEKVRMEEVSDIDAVSGKSWRRLLAPLEDHSSLLFDGTVPILNAGLVGVVLIDERRPGLKGSPARGMTVANCRKSCAWGESGVGAGSTKEYETCSLTRTCTLGSIGSGLEDG